MRPASRRPRVLVICKKSAYQRLVRERRGGHAARLLEAGDPSVARFMDAHETHMQTIIKAREALRTIGAAASFRTLRTRASGDDFDLVVTLGGDGTLLWASHLVGSDTPVIGINTAPGTSVGYFCAGDDATMADVFRDGLAGKLPGTSLSRMQVDIDGAAVSTRVLNDALYSAACPAATTRYILRSGGVEEEQKSSGLWVGPAAGSTAAQRSAGGKVLPIRSKRLQFIVREPYPRDGAPYELVKGLIQPGDELQLRSKLTASCLFLDGPHREYKVKLGSVLRFRLSEEPLTLLGLRRD